MAKCSNCGAAGEGHSCKYCGGVLTEAAPPSTSADVASGGVLARPEDDDSVAYVVAQPIPAGTQVTVGADDAFVALAQGVVLAVLETGRHMLPRALDAAVFVCKVAYSYPLSRELTSAAGEGMRAYGTLDLTVAEPAAFVGATRDLRVLEAEAFDELCVKSAGDLIERAVAAAAQRGVTPDALGDALPELLQQAAALWAIPGTKVDLSAIEVSTGAEEESEEEGDDEEEGTGDLTDLIGEEVTVTKPNGKRARATVEGVGYLVRYENGESSWVSIEAVEVE